MKRLLLLSLLGSSGLLAQINFIATKTTTLSGAAEVITIQQPSSASKKVDLLTAYVDCSVACTVTLERNGNPATSTTLTPQAVNPGEGTVTATAWSSSNVGTGTVLSVISLTAGASVIYDLAGMNFSNKNNRGENFTIRTSSITGDVHINVKWSER